MATGRLAAVDRSTTTVCGGRIIAPPIAAAPGAAAPHPLELTAVRKLVTLPNGMAAALTRDV